MELGGRTPTRFEISAPGSRLKQDSMFRAPGALGCSELPSPQSSPTRPLRLLEPLGVTPGEVGLTS